MGPDIKNVDRSNIATDFSSDFISMLQNLMGGGGFGAFTQEGRTAGNIATTIGNQAAGGTLVRDVPSDVEGIAGLLRPQHSIGLRENVADQREQFGAEGRRFGTSQAVGEARLRGGMEADFQARIAQILPQLLQIGVNRDLGQAGVGLQAGGLLGNLQNSNINPFLQIAGRGILDPETVVTPSPFNQFLNAGVSLGGQFLGSKFGENFGGGPGGGGAGGPNFAPGVGNTAHPGFPPVPGQGVGG